MTTLFWTLYLISMFGIGGRIAEITYQAPKRCTETGREPLDLDFTQFETNFQRKS